MTTKESPSTDRLWTEFAAEMRQFLRRRLPDDSVADDLLQETFLRVHRNQGSLQSSQSARAWVYQIARNLVIDYYRGEARSTLEDVDSLPDESHTPDMAVTTINKLVQGWLLTAIEALPDTYREATRLSAVDGLSQQEIADRLGISLEAAKSRIRRGREQLKSSLNACCSFERDSRGNLVDYQPNQLGSCCGDGHRCEEEV